VKTLITGICTTLACSLAFADSSTHDDIFTTSQAEAGKTVYNLKCALCHGTKLEGTEAGGALAGSAFQTKWLAQPLETLQLLTRTTMPLDAPGALSSTDYENVIAYLLSQNGVELVAGTATSTESTEWLHHRGDPGSTNYSPLDLINKDNVASLEVAWRWRSDNFGPGIWPNLQTTPIMADGVLYATAGSRRTVVAIDAATGETLWMHRIDEGARGDNAPRKGPGRGVAFWREDGESRVFVITPGYQLLALDAASGQPVTEFGTSGHVDLKLALDQDLDLTDSRIGASSPPIIVGDVVIVGAAFPAGGAPPAMEMPVGNVSAYDVRSGEQRWIFNTLPQAEEEGNDTWKEGSSSYTGNIGVWAPMSADPELGYVYLPVEAATGDFYGGHRPGDNLYSQSLVCLDARTGERVWHFQTVHHGIWDYDLPTAPILVDVQRAGRTIPAVAQLTKQGFTFVFDRRTGEPVWPIEERAVPRSDVPGEVSSTTQPFPTLPVPFAVQGVGPGTVNDLTPEIHAEALGIIESGRTGPLFTPPSIESDTNTGTFVAPGASGGANWQGGVADPESGVLYVASTNSIGIVGLVSAPDRSNMRYVLNRKQPEKPFGLPLGKPPWGTITAIDLKTGQHLWQIANGDTPDYVNEHPKLQGIDLPRTGHDERAGMLVTKSLLFAGEGAGLYVATEGGSKFRAHDKATGEILHEIDLGANQSGLPMTYAINGKQYIVVAVGAPNQAGELVALSILPDQSQ